MRKIIFFNLFIAVMAICLMTACGGSSKEKTTDVSTEEEVATDEEFGTDDELETTVYDIDDEPDDEDYDEPTISTKSEDWDAILKDYEVFIDKYISLMKKAQSGDMTALTEYTEYLEKATALSNKLGNAGSNLSASQAAKFAKLQAKLAKAAANL